MFIRITLTTNTDAVALLSRFGSPFWCCEYKTPLSHLIRCWDEHTFLLKPLKTHLFSSFHQHCVLISSPRTAEETEHCQHVEVLHEKTKNAFAANHVAARQLSNISVTSLIKRGTENGLLCAHMSDARETEFERWKHTLFKCFYCLTRQT